MIFPGLNTDCFVLLGECGCLAGRISFVFGWWIGYNISLRWVSCPIYLPRFPDFVGLTVVLFGRFRSWWLCIIGSRLQINGRTRWQHLVDHLYGIKTLSVRVQSPEALPESTDVSCDCSPSTMVFIFLVVKKFVSHEWRVPFMPYWWSLCNNLSWGTVSKAFEKSKIGVIIVKSLDDVCVDIFPFCFSERSLYLFFVWAVVAPLFLFFRLVENLCFRLIIFLCFLVIHGMLFRDRISLCGMLLFIVPNSSFLKVSHSWCTEWPFSLLFSTVVCRFSRSMFILVQSALLYM